MHRYCVLRGLLALGACLVLAATASAAPPLAAAHDTPEPTTPVYSRTSHPLPPAATDADFHPRDRAKEALGKLLFFDKILSGNLNISCATCHHPLADTGDGLSLPVGEGGQGIGVTRNTGLDGDAVHERVPRNAPHIFNLGAREFTVMFHDGRVEVDPSQPSGFRSPAGDDLPSGLDTVLSAQAMFPVTSGTEMAGQAGENPIADAAAAGDLAGPGGVWEQLAERLRAIPEYVDLFVSAFDDVHAAEDITYVHAANAMGAFEAVAWRATGSPFDRYLRGEVGAMSEAQLRGMELFYGEANCAACHSGTFQTNHQFAAIGMPQIGPGKGDNLPGYTDGLDDFGRERVTGDEADRFRFRVPSLRNVRLTGPWGHAGAYNDLETVVRHHMRPRMFLRSYDPSQAVMPSRADLDAIDFAVMNDINSVNAIAARVEIEVIPRPPEDVAALLDFLDALTDPSSIDLRLDVPKSVPSGLPVIE